MDQENETHLIVTNIALYQHIEAAPTNEQAFCCVRSVLGVRAS